MFSVERATVSKAKFQNRIVSFAPMHIRLKSTSSPALPNIATIAEVKKTKTIERRVELCAQK
jgi:hypothetical protein